MFFRKHCVCSIGSFVNSFTFKSTSKLQRRCLLFPRNQLKGENDRLLILADLLKFQRGKPSDSLNSLHQETDFRKLIMQWLS